MEWINKLSQNLKRYHCKLVFFTSQKRQSNTIKIEGKYPLSVEFKVRMGVAYVSLYDSNAWISGTCPKGMQENILSSIEEAAIKLGSGMMYVGMEGDVQFEMDGYRKPKCSFFPYEGWVKEFHPDIEKGVEGIHRMMNHTLKKMELEYPTFSYKKKKECFRFYYEGYTGEFQLYYRNEAFFVKEIGLKQEFALEKKEDFEEGARHTLELIQKKTRLKNIMEPPQHHFKKMMEKKISYGIEELFHVLATKMNPSEIERKSALMNKSSSSLAITKVNDYLIIELFGFYLLTKRFKSIGIFDTKSEAKNKLKGYLMDEVNEKLNNAFN